MNLGVVVETCAYATRYCCIRAIYRAAVLATFCFFACMDGEGGDHAGDYQRGGGDSTCAGFEG